MIGRRVGNHEGFLFLTRIVPIYVLNGLDETKLFISVHLFNAFLEGISGENA